MKIILHMGLRKTGTTSLQNALFASRDKLRERGVLYPHGGASRENHRLLTALFKPADRIKREVQYLFDFDRARMQRAAIDMWETIRRDVQRTKPQLLVLSSEYFVTYPQSEDFDKLAAILSDLSADIEPVLYFREPAAHYASNVQQNVKKGDAIYPIDGSGLQRIVPWIESAFGRPIAACVADRDQLVSGDIVVDFLSRFVAPVVGAIDIPTVRLNESMSAEELAILDRFRKLRYSNDVGLMPDLFSLRVIPRRLERRSGVPSSLKLKSDVVRAVRRDLDLLWLRERYGLVFNGVDYAAVDGAPFKVDPAETTIEDLFEVDLHRRDALQAEALAEALGSWRLIERTPLLSRFIAAARRGLIVPRRGAA